jgi:hypothetical protein
MARRPSTLAEVQRRLDQLVEQRTVSGLSLSEETEYRDLVALESELLAATPRRAGFGGLVRGDT